MRTREKEGVGEGERTAAAARGFDHSCWNIDSFENAQRVIQRRA
jgi:hypothetical protein